MKLCTPLLAILMPTLASADEVLLNWREDTGAWVGKRLTTVPGHYLSFDANGVPTILPYTGATGDVVGPASATSGAFPTFSGTTGKVIANSIYTPAYVLSRANHSGTQAVNTITGLAPVATSGSATDLSAGSLADARLSANIPRLASANTFTADTQTIATANLPALVVNSTGGSGTNKAAAFAAGAGAGVISFDNSGDFGIGSNTKANVTTAPGSGGDTYRLWIKGATGNVGIGTTSPSSKLHVAETWNGSVINVTGASGTGSFATITFATQAAAIPVGTTVVIASVNPSGYNGAAVVTASSVTSVSYANATTAAYVSGGTVQRQFTAIKANVTDTASHTSSNLLDLQAGGTSKFNVNKGGGIVSKANIITANGDAGAAGLSLEMVFANYGLGIDSNGNTAFLLNGTAKSRAGFGVVIASDQSLSFTNTTHVGVNATPDTILLRDGAANTLALRNGAAAQTFRVYNTYSNAGVDVEYLQLSTSVNGFRVGTNSSGSGTPRPLFLGVGGGSQWQINTAGHIGTFGSDNLYDIGASGANRPRNLFIGGSADVAGTFACPTIYTGPTGNATALTTPTNGVFRITNNSATDFNRLQFGGGTSSFPAIKRVGAEFQIVKADTAAASNVAAADADMTFIEDRYRRKGTGTPEAAVTAPIGAVYHRTDGGAGTSFYVKESGTGNTGWVAK